MRLSGALRLVLCLLVALIARPAVAQSPEQILEEQRRERAPVGVDLYPGIGGRVRQDAWASYVVELTNRTSDGMTVDVSLEGGQARTRAMENSRSVELPPGAQKTVFLYLPVTNPGRDREVLVSRGIRTLNWHRQPVQTLDENSRLIAVVGQDALGINAIRSSTGYDGQQRSVSVALLPESHLPDRWIGYQALDVLVWPDPRPERLSPEQREALETWVASGGRLLVAAGAGSWQAVAGSFLGDLLPVRLRGTVDVQGGLPELHQLLAATAPLETDTVPVVESLLREAPADARVLVSAGELPLYTSRRFGAGHVAFLGASPSVAPLRGVLPREQLWRELLRLPQPTVAEGRLDPFGEMSGSTPDRFLTDTYGSLVARIEGVEPVPMSFLLGFAAIYLLVIGPLDYLVLRVMKKLEWTWFTFPAAIAVFSVVAWWGARAAKGDVSRARAVNLVDVFPEAGVWRGASWVGLFTVDRGELMALPPLGSGPVEALQDRHSYDPEERVLRAQTLVDDGAVTRLRFRVAPWDMNLLVGAWAGRSADGAQVTRNSDGVVLNSNLGVALEDAVLRCPSGTWTVGTLDASDQVTLPTLAPGGDALAGLTGDRRLVAEQQQSNVHGYYPRWSPETAIGAGHCVLTGFAAEPSLGFRFDGADIRDEGETLVRVDLGLERVPR